MAIDPRGHHGAADMRMFMRRAWVIDSSIGTKRSLYYGGPTGCWVTCLEREPPQIAMSMVQPYYTPSATGRRELCARDAPILWQLVRADLGAGGDI